MKIIDIQQNTPEWIELRQSKIGASDAPIIMGVSPWKKPNELWEEKLGFKKSSFNSDAMQRGHQLEPVARAMCEKYFECALYPVIGIHDENDWAMASFDAYNENGLIVEIKCPGKVDHQTALDGKIPDKYYPQLQHQMYVANCIDMYYCSFDGVNCVYVHVKRNDQYIDQMIQKELEFYQCMIQRIPPVYIAQIEEPIWADYMTQLMQAKDQIKLLDGLQKDLMSKLTQLAGESEAQGMGFKLSKIERRGNIDYEAIVKEHNIDVNFDNYRKKSTFYYQASAG